LVPAGGPIPHGSDVGGGLRFVEFGSPTGCRRFLTRFDHRHRVCCEISGCKQSCRGLRAFLDVATVHRGPPSGNRTGQSPSPRSTPDTDAPYNCQLRTHLGRRPRGKPHTANSNTESTLNRRLAEPAAPRCAEDKPMAVCAASARPHSLHLPIDQTEEALLQAPPRCVGSGVTGLRSHVEVRLRNVTERSQHELGVGAARFVLRQGGPLGPACRRDRREPPARKQHAIGFHQWQVGFCE